MNLSIAILGSSYEVSAACRLDEIEVLVDYLISVDPRLELKAVIVNTNPLSEEDSLLLARSYETLLRSGYDVCAVTGQLEASTIIIDDEFFAIELPVVVEHSTNRKRIREAKNYIAELQRLPDLAIPIYSHQELFPDEYEESDEFEERVRENYESIVRPYSEELLKQLADRPEKLYEMDSRSFEELIALLMEKLGFQIELTPKTRDGGRDVLARKRDAIGETLLLVECKRYAPNRLVGIECVRSLYGVVMAERATTGLVVTTSGFSKDAVKFATELKYQMSLKDYNDLMKWIRA